MKHRTSGVSSASVVCGRGGKRFVGVSGCRCRTVTDGRVRERDVKVVVSVAFVCQCVQEEMERVTNECGCGVGRRQKNDGARTELQLAVMQ